MMGFPRVSYQEVVPGWSEEGFDLLEVIVLDKTPPGARGKDFEGPLFELLFLFYYL